MRLVSRDLVLAACATVLTACGEATPPADQQEQLTNAIIHPTVEGAEASRTPVVGGSAASSGGNLYYHGGTGGIGVETAPKVYLVLWGSQWSSDPSGEASLLQSFLSGVGGSSWFNSVTQYCQGVASGTFTCPSGSAFAGNPAGILAGVWFDNAGPAPTHPRQSQLAAEAVSAANHFGNTTGASNASVQYVIATSHGNSSRGFGTQYCAYHSSTSSTVGNVAYTNLPYITDAGASCGANFNGLGPNAGITIVEGHETRRNGERPVPEHRLARRLGRRERRQVRLDRFGAGRVGQRDLQQRHVPGAVAVEQRVQRWRRRLRAVVSVGYP
jgi:serine protease